MMKLSVWEGGITLAKVQIKVNDNGSFRVTGDVELVDSQGNVFPAKPKIFFMPLWFIKNMPYCDASHKGKFESVVRAPEQNNFTCDMHIFVHVFSFSNSVISLLLTTFLILLFPFQPAYIFTQFFTFEYFY